MFLYFLDCNNALFFGDCKAIDDSTLVAITVMIAESLPEEKDVYKRQVCTSPGGLGKQSSSKEN